MRIRRPALFVALAPALALASTAMAAEPEELSPHAVRKIVDRARGAIIRVVSEPQGTAVLIGIHGEVLADLRLVARDRLDVEARGERRVATLVDQDPLLGLALLRLPAGEYPAASVGSSAALVSGDALVGLAFDARGGFRALVGHYAGGAQARAGAARLRTDVPGPPGTALFNSKGQLVAVHAGRPRGTLGIDDVRRRFAASRSP